MVETNVAAHQRPDSAAVHRPHVSEQVSMASVDRPNPEVVREGRPGMPIMLTVADLMTVTPVTVSPNTLLNEVATIMKRGSFRQLPVVENSELVGIITDRDLHNVSADGNYGLATAESCMTPNPITVSPDTPAYRAATMLSVYKFGALPVIHENRLVGIVTVSDFLDYFVVESPHNSDASRGFPRRLRKEDHSPETQQSDNPSL